MTIPVYQVDAFTQQHFAGNPAAVCLLPGEKQASWMQSVAAEMNLSETAFVHPHNGGYKLRWFTPVAEVNLCGHATLATAHVLWESGKVESQQSIEFYTNSGILTTQNFNGYIEMDFPSESAEKCVEPKALSEALGISPIKVLMCQSDYLVVLENEDAVKYLQPDLKALKDIAVRGVIVTAHSNSDEYDFVSRFFAPRLGIDEDPVTGSVHCVLAPYWADKLGKQHLKARQLSQRGGMLDLSLQNGRVLIRGEACTVLKGELYAE